jgi:hypothetical protein
MAWARGSALLIALPAAVLALPARTTLYGSPARAFLEPSGSLLD